MENHLDGHSVEARVQALEWFLPRVASVLLMKAFQSPIPSS